MFRIRPAHLLALVALFAGQTFASTAPTLFAGETTWGFASNWNSGSDASPAFTPDGKTVFFTHGAGDKRTIMVSHLSHGSWSKPESAPFSGQWMDIEPAMAPDGSYLVFISNRPATPGGKALDGHYGGSVQPGWGGNLWRVNRVGKGWSEPVRLPDVINSNCSIYAPAVARDGSLYFMQPDPATNKFRLYRSQFAHGTFAAPEPLSFSDGVTADFDPVVAPDESFIIFSSRRQPAPEKHSAIFVAFSENHHWSAPVPFQPFWLGIESRLSPDRKTLYFTSSQPTLEAAPAAQTSSPVPQRIWQVSLEGLVAMRKASR
jgi:Tol biopolymer transport system component